MISLSDTLYAKIRQYQGETRLCLKRYKYPAANGPTKGYPTTLSMNLNELQNLLHYQKRLQIEMYVRHPAYQTAGGAAAAVSSAMSAAEGSTKREPRLKRKPRFYVYEERHLQQLQGQQQQQKQQRRQRRVKKKTDLPTDVVGDSQSVEDLVMTATESAGITSESLREDQQQPSGRWENPEIPYLTTDTNSWLHPAYLADTDVDTEVEEGD